jgi:hypothetical protein
MAHKLINGKVVVDWSTGDPEGDRITVLAAYRDFIKELLQILNQEGYYSSQQIIGSYDQHFEVIYEHFKKWGIDTENQIDEVPRIWIKRPE